jgi:hypothetical protein
MSAATGRVAGAAEVVPAEAVFVGPEEEQPYIDKAATTAPPKAMAHLL